MGILWQDLRYGVRMLAKSPGFTAITILTLALGIGANTAIFSVVNRVLLRPLPYPAPQQIVTLYESIFIKGEQDSVSGPNFLDWRAQNRSFSALAAHFTSGFNLTGRGDPQRIASEYVSEDFFKILGAAPSMGRSFLPEEFGAGGNRVVILSDGLWRRVFGADPGIVGKPVTLSGLSYTVVGILPAGFQALNRAELWTPLQADNRLLGPERDEHWLRVLGRLQEGVSLSSARADMETISSHLRQQYPTSNDSRGVVIRSLQEERVSGIRLALLVLQAAVGFVLLIACVNVANLLLARSNSRRKEMALRATLGAGPVRVVRQLLSENILLALLGAGIGLMVAEFGTGALLSMAPAELLRQTGPVAIDHTVLAFTLVLSIVSGVFFGLAPAIQATRLDLNQTLREAGERSGSGRSASRFKNALVVIEISLATVLLAGGGLLIRSFGSLIHVSPGIDPRGVLTMQFYLPAVSPADIPGRLASFRAMLESIRHVAGVQAASSVIDLPFSGHNITGDFKIEGRAAPKPSQTDYVEYRIVNPEFFTAMGMPLLQGRDLNEKDEATRANVVVIDKMAAASYFPGENPIGKRVSLWAEPAGGSDKRVWLEVVGVVPEVHQFGLDQPPHPSAYFCMSAVSDDYLARLLPVSPISIVLRTLAAPASVSKPVVDAIHSVDRDAPVEEILPMETILTESLAQARLASLLLGTFSGLALLLAAIGIYGVMSYNVSQRAREIGIRMALGAQHSAILGLVVRNGMLLGLIGLTAGLAAATALSRFLKGLLFGVDAADPVTLGAVAIVLAVVVFLACYIPARRAMRVDPMVALRQD